MIINSNKKNLNQWKIIRTMLTNCIEMLVLGKNWTTRHSVVGQQIGSCSHEMDSSIDFMLVILGEFFVFFGVEHSSL